MTDEVRQEDREAAAVFADDVLTGWCAIGGNDVAAIRNGFWDNDDTDLGQIVQAFARHASPLRDRIAVLEEMLGEARKWLAGQPHTATARHDTLAEMIDAIDATLNGEKKDG